MKKQVMMVLRKFDVRDANIARKWLVEITGDILIFAFAVFLGYTIKTYFM